MQFLGRTSRNYATGRPERRVMPDSEIEVNGGIVVYELSDPTTARSSS